MKRLRFSEDAGEEFYKELKQRVNDYFKATGVTRHGGRKMWWKIGLYFSLDVLFFGLMITSTSVGTFFLWYLLMGFSVLLTAFNISHDAAHNVAVKGKRWNDLLFSMSFNLQGNNAYVWGKNHNESHHLYTNVEGSDIDVLNNPVFRMTTNQPLRWFHKYQHWYAPVLYLFYSLNWFFFRETLMVLGYSSRTIAIKIPRNEVLKLIGYKLFYIGYMIVLPAVLLPFGWDNVLLAFLLNHFMVSILFVGVLGVSHLSDYVDHPEANQKGIIPVSWPMLQMKTSVDYNPGSVLLNWTLGGFNAHTLHHLLPSVSHIHYLEVLPILREVSQKHGIQYMEMTYWESLCSHFRFLRLMGRNVQPNVRIYEK